MSRRSNVMTFPLVPSQAILDAVGEEINDLCGVWITRLTEPALLGATSLKVETTVALTPSGFFLIEGRRHSFNAVDPVTLSISPALYSNYRAMTPVVCLTRILPGMDAAKNQLFIDTAEGEFLDAIGRNYRVDRPDGVGDVVFREIIKATAFLPRSTLYALETVLDAFVGAGLYEIFEDRVNHPKKVFLTINDDVSAVAFKSYLTNQEELAPFDGGHDSVEPSSPPLGDSYDAVVSVRLAPHEVSFVAGSLPTTQGWSWAGSVSEGVMSSIEASGALLIEDVDVESAVYARPVRAAKASGFVVDARVELASATPGGSTLEQRTCAFVEICDGSRQILIGMDDDNVYTLNGSTGAADLTIPRNGVTERDLRVVKRSRIGLTDGEAEIDSYVEIFINGVLRGGTPYSFFATSAVHRVRFGTSATSTSETRWLSLTASFDDASNLWNLQGLLGEALDAQTLSITNATPLTASMDGKGLVVAGAVAAHARANGQYVIDNVDSTTDARLVGITHLSGACEAPDAFSISVDNYELFSAEDAGVQASVATGSGASALSWTARLGCAGGSAITVALVNPGANNAQIDVSVTGLALTVNPATNNVGTIVSTAADIAAAVNANAQASALLTVTLGGAGTGLVTALPATNLAGGEDGKILAVMSGANAGARVNIATLLSDREVLVGTYSAPASFVESADVQWRKDPNFLGSEVDLRVEIAAAGEVQTTPDYLLLLASGLPTLDAAVALFETTYIVHKSAEALYDVSVVDVVGRAPLYLFDRLAFLQAVLEDVLPKGTTLVLGENS